MVRCSSDVGAEAETAAAVPNPTAVGAVVVVEVVVGGAELVSAAASSR